MCDYDYMKESNFFGQIYIVPILGVVFVELLFSWWDRKESLKCFKISSVFIIICKKGFCYVWFCHFSFPCIKDFLCLVHSRGIPYNYHLSSKWTTMYSWEHQLSVRRRFTKSKYATAQSNWTSQLLHQELFELSAQ